MTIVKKGQSKINKCDIQLEDWSKNYPGLYEPGAYLAAYPKAAKTIWHADKGRNIFKAGVEFRMDLPFETAKEAEEAFTALEAGGEVPLRLHPAVHEHVRLRNGLGSERVSVPRTRHHRLIPPKTGGLFRALPLTKKIRRISK